MYDGTWRKDFYARSFFADSTAWRIQTVRQDGHALMDVRNSGEPSVARAA
jgi:hypothetical protein